MINLKYCLSSQDLNLILLFYAIQVQLSLYFFNVRCRRRQSNEGDGGFIKHLNIKAIGHPDRGSSRIVVSFVLIDAKLRLSV